ncbi:MAG: thiol reductase thioredoxin, partial [Candidatus Sedimenticola endophacoides]
EAAAQSRVFSVPTLQIYFEGQHFITKGRSFSLTELSSDLERPYQLFFG